MGINVQYARRLDRQEHLVGSLSPFSAIALFLCICFILTLTEAARTNANYVYIQYAMTSATDCLMGNYCKELANNYGIYAFDGSYMGGAGVSEEQLQAEYRAYLEFYAEPKGFTLYNFSVEDVAMSYKRMTDDNGTYFLESIYDDMKYQEIYYGLEWFLSIKNLLTEDAKQSDEVEQSLTEVRTSINESQTKHIKAYLQDDPDAVSMFCDYDVSSEENQMEYLNFFAILSQPKLLFFSGEEFEMANRPSDGFTFPEGHDYAREFIHAFAKGEAANYLLQFGASNIKKAMLIQYISNHMTCFTTADVEKETGPKLDYEIEYILCCKNNETDNVTGTIAVIRIIRMFTNIAHILTCEEKMKTVTDAAEATFGIIFGKLGAEIGKYLIVVLWASLESMTDANRLSNGEKMHLIKEEQEWVTDLDGLIKSATEGGVFLLVKNLWNQLPIAKGEEAEIAPVETETSTLPFNPEVTYKDYLIFLLFLCDTSTLCYYTMDVIQYHMQELNGNFRMSDLIYAFDMQVQAKVCPMLIRKKKEEFGIVLFEALYQTKVFYSYERY